MGRESAFLELESILLACNLQAWVSGISVDSDILHENAKQIADGMEIHYFAACSAIFKKYLQCILTAKILTVDFVVCTLAVKKKKTAGFDMSDWTIPL
jgi:hypothetical protein